METERAFENNVSGSESAISAEDIKLVETQILSGPVREGLLKIRNLECNVFLTESVNSDSGELNGIPAEYHYNYSTNSHESEWSIYIWEDLSENIKKMLLFHEVVEVGFREAGLDVHSAHHKALSFEKDFFRNFSPEEVKEFEKLRERYSDIEEAA